MPVSSGTDVLRRLGLFAGNRRLEKLEPVSVQCQYRVNSIPSMEIVLSTRDGDPGSVDDEVALCQPGNRLRVTAEDDRYVMLDGAVTRLSRRTRMSRSDLTLHVRHPLQRLASSHRSQIFEGLTDAAIITSICKDHGITVEVAGLSIKHPQMVQFECSDWQFMLARLKASAVWLLPQPGVTRIGAPRLGPADHTLSMKPDGRNSADAQGNIEEAAWQFDVADLAPGVRMSGWDPQLQKRVDVDAEAVALGRGALDARQLKTLDNQRWSSARSTALQPTELGVIARSRLQSQHLNSVIARFVVSGSLDYRIGQTLALSGFGRNFDGAGIITGVEQLIAEGSWRTALDIGVKDAWPEFDASGVPSAGGTYVGIVEAFQRDSDGLDRFRIRIPALMADRPLWARFSTPYAGKSHGLYLYPEIGDEVCVTFFDRDPRYPLIVNAMFNPKNPPPVASGDSPPPRALVFDSEKKHQLVFDAKSGALSLEAGDDTVVFKKGIALKSANNVSVDGQAIAMSASKGVEVKGGKSVSIKGPEIGLDS